MLKGEGEIWATNRLTWPVARYPPIAFDYLLMNVKGSLLRAEVDEAAFENDSMGVKVLVVKDAKSKMLFAHVVPSKGVDETRYAVDAVTADIVWLGYTKVILKSDNEPAILKRCEEALEELRVGSFCMEQVAVDHPPPHDRQANGQAESGVKSVRG